MKSATILNYIRGYLSVCADGRFTERLINICMHRNMPVWDVKRCGERRITFKTSVDAFKNIRTPARRTKSRVRIIKRHGLPFLLRRYRKRKLAVLGFVVCLLMIWYSSTHIMGITVFGNERIPTQDILSALAECGVELGARTDKTNPDIIRNRMMSKLDSLAWIGINASGARVYIEVVERIEKEKGIEKDGISCNLIAKADGEIERLEIREGQTLVSIGSGVRKGDVLVSGIVDNASSGFRYVKARGDVFAKTRYVLERSFPFEYKEKVKTGKEKERYTISILNTKLPLFIKKTAPYDSFEYIESNKEYRLPIESLPSLFIKSEKYIEEVEQTKKRSLDETIEMGKAELEEELMSTLGEGAEILERNMDYTLTEFNEARIRVELVCRENIAEEAVIEKLLPEEN